jgi:iron uptake system EfeUOB component EfeO/EfeM
MAFDPTISNDKSEPMRDELDKLLPAMAQRMEDYQETRSDEHWEGDHAHHHVEKAMGELAMAYAEAKDGDSDEVMLREAADAINHLLMALDIGAGHVRLDEKGRRMDRDGY